MCDSMFKALKNKCTSQKDKKRHLFLEKMLKKDEQQEVIFAFIISDGSIREDRRWMMHKSQIYMTLSNYPIHKMIMLDNIEGF